MKKTFPLISIIAAFFIASGSTVMAQEPVNIYYNQACSDCITYIQEIQPVLDKYGISPNLKDYINQPDYRKDLNKENKIYQVPVELQDSLTIFLKTNLIIEGHVPIKIVDRILSAYPTLPKHKLIVLYQPEMHSDVDDLTLYISGYSPEKISVRENIVNLIHGR